jgi:Protein of unknown function (DUF2855)
MTSKVPQIQILEKLDHFKQHLVALPNAYPLPPLTPGSIRTQSQILSLTANTLTYARLGNVFGWWDVWDVAPCLPSPYNDTSKYGRISSWGFSEVIESMHEDVPVGTKLWGYMAIGDYPETLQVEVESETGHLMETSQRRHHIWEIYNRYRPFPPDTDLLADKESHGWDANMQVLFETSYMLNRYAFSWDRDALQPWGDKIPWTKQDADLTDSVVFLLAPSGKTGLGFAHQLRHGRPANRQPRKVIAIGSANSRAFTQATGLFDDLLLYSDSANLDLKERAGLDENTKISLIVFSVRDDADYDWFHAIKGISDNVKVVLVGGDPTTKGIPKIGSLLQDPNSGVVRANASVLRDLAMAADGKAKYFKDVSTEWEKFKQGGMVPGLKLKWGKGMEAFAEGWEALSTGKVEPSSCLVYKL